MVSRVAYSFSNVRFSIGGQVEVAGQVTDRSNVNVRFPVTRLSPDRMGAAGEFDFVDFSATGGSIVRVEFVPDVANVADPTCTIPFRLP